MRRACSRGSADRQTDTQSDSATDGRRAPQYLLRCVCSLPSEICCVVTINKLNIVCRRPVGKPVADNAMHQMH